MLRAVPAPCDGAARLQALVPFAQLDDDARAELAAAVEWIEAPAGVRLFSVGDSTDGMYGILSGRVRFFAEEDGDIVLTADAGPGVTFGEGSMLVGGGRSRTAVVARDALLIRVPPEQFKKLMTSPHVAVGVASLFAARFASQPDPATGQEHPPAIAVDAQLAPPDRAWLVGELTRAVGERATVTVIEGVGAEAERLVRHADVLLLAREAHRRPYGLDPLASWWAGVDPLALPPVDLVLMRAGEDVAPGAAATWREAVGPAACHHVRRGVAGDVRRVGRHLTGTAVGLVLGGGGARGMAHIGVLRAMAELGIPVDSVGGSSMGAVVAAEVALGRPWDQILDESEQTWRRRSLRLDLTLPTVSVSSGRRARRIFEEMFGLTCLEDFLVPYFCTTTNLSRFELAIHRAGPAAPWIRASATAPGLWPPVVDAAGELHVDGGQLDNVPTDVMRRAHRGPIIAVDVCAGQQAMTVEPGTEPPVGLRHLLRRRAAARFPSLVDTINRCALLGSLQQRVRAADQADVYLTPDLATIGFGGFGRLHEAVEIGYRVAIGELGAAWTSDRAAAG